MIRFGSFEIDPRTWTLSRDGAPLNLSPRLVEILAHLVARPGAIVTKDELLERFWPGINVGENTLSRAVADIRKVLGDSAASPTYLQTLARRGYRFMGEGPLGSVEPEGQRPAARAAATSAEDPFQAWVKGRLALDSLDLGKLVQATEAFERAAVDLPAYAPAHAGLANAYLLQFEQTRSGSVPDRNLLTRAMTAARQACAVDPSLGEGWAVLGYLLSADGRTEEAQAAGRRATALEPDNWRHQYRLAYSTWGEERLRAVDRTLTLKPGFAPARMLAAMVFIARGALERAEREATLGAVSQREQRNDRTPLPAVGLHWLRGLVMAARGDRLHALECFEEEIAAGTSGHIYAREFAANARVAAGFTHLTQTDLPSATEAFQETLAEAAGHPRATLGLYAVAVRSADTAGVDRLKEATAGAIADLIRGERHGEAALLQVCELIVRGQTV